MQRVATYYYQSHIWEVVKLKQFFERVAQDKRLSDGARVLLLYLIVAANGSDYIKITDSKLVEVLHVNHSTVNRRLVTLEKAGYIKRVATDESNTKHRRIIRIDYQKYAMFFQIGSTVEYFVNTKLEEVEK